MAISLDADGVKLDGTLKVPMGLNLKTENNKLTSLSGGALDIVVASATSNENPVNFYTAKLWRYRQQNTGANNLVRLKDFLGNNIPFSSSGSGSLTLELNITTLGTSTGGCYSFAVYHKSDGNKEIKVLAGNGYQSKSSNRPYFDTDGDGYLCWAMDHDGNYWVEINIRKLGGTLL